MSATPRTDEAVNDTALENKNHPHTDWVTATFARQLETELTFAQQKIKELDDKWTEVSDTLAEVAETCHQRGEKIITLTTQIEKMREALRKYGNHIRTCPTQYDIHRGGAGNCNCGYSEALSQPSEPLRKEGDEK